MKKPRLMYWRQKAGFISVFFFTRRSQVVEAVNCVLIEAIICGLYRQILNFLVKIYVSQSTGYRGSPLEQFLHTGRVKRNNVCTCG